MPDRDEIDMRINEQIDRQEVREAILKTEIETLKKAVKQVENVSGLSESKSRGAAD